MVLQDKLRISNKKLEEYETRFKCQEETTQKLMLEYQARLEESEERLRRQQEDKEIQMKGIISRYREMGALEATGTQPGWHLEPIPTLENHVSLELQAGFPAFIHSCLHGLQPLQGISSTDSLGPPVSVTWDKEKP